MEDNKVWYGLIRWFAITVCVLIASVSGCNMNRQYQTRMLIENAKVDPIAAKCAVDGDSSQMCMIKAAK